MEIPISDPTHAAEARRAATRMAIESGFGEPEQGKLALIVTEISTNLLKHARLGRVVLSPVSDPSGVDVFGVDSGPGMPNLSECMRDGFSTAGSPGTGLGAIRRLSSEMDIFTGLGQGTVVWARCLAQPAAGFPSRAPKFDAGGIVVPFPGCMESGDAWTSRNSDECISVMVADGLGHGDGAAEAAQAAVKAFESAKEVSGPTLLAEMDHALHGTRGAAVAIAQIEPAREQASFCGIGNIAGTIVNADSAQHLVSMNGIIGNHIGKPREFTYTWTSTSVLVLHSDGIRSRWKLGDYDGLSSKRSAVAAALIWRDAARATDDASVVVVRERNPAHGA